MRLSPLRRGLFAVAFSTTMIGAGAVPPASADASSPGATSSSPRALSQNQGTSAAPPTAGISKVAVAKRRIDIHAGRRTVVRGAVLPRAAGLVASLQVRRGARWHTLDRDRTGTRGRYVLRDRRKHPMSAPARVHVRGNGARAKQRIGRLNVYRVALASWYGPGLYGRRTGCGRALGYRRLGVAHKTLPCGTKITLRHGGRRVRVPVIDRGPYSGAREYDLTAATARKLRFRGHGGILTTR
ncbi:MAG: RlpA-like double-psi beta-barrel domain-containing protein [Solirubrobacteraceae bacterium]